MVFEEHKEKRGHVPPQVSQPSTRVWRSPDAKCAGKKKTRLAAGSWLEVESHQRKLCRAVDFRGTAAFAGVAPSVRFDAFGWLTTSKAEAHVVGVQFLQ